MIRVGLVFLHSILLILILLIGKTLFEGVLTKAKFLADLKKPLFGISR